MAQLIELNAQENSPFESEPQLLGVYHWSEGLRSMHKHDDRLELNFIFSGNGTQVIDGELCNVQAGDVLIHNGGVLHDESLMIASELKAWCIAVKNLKLPDCPVNELVPKNFRPRIPCQAVADQLAQLYPLIHFYAEQAGGYQIANSLARAVVLIVHKIIRSTALEFTKEKNFIVERVRNYIEEHYAEDLNLAELSGLVRANEFYLSHAFKKATGYSPKEYILRRRIGKAQCLLIYTTLPLTEISARVGYEDSNYFSRAFKKIIGVSPRLYRQKWNELSSGSVPSDV
ncbi:MAG: AraC family transcriptional regulator [Selenomonadaceae bacterium]|nr:AraC family transcriptional regulator [Selenomonadaceae bacterium]MBQ6131985.1 AraC family transcriptional regulator [Selenomonadaceae bacterium]